MSTDTAHEVVIPHFGESRIDQLLERMDADSKALSNLLNGFSWSEHTQRKVNRSLVRQRLRTLADAWDKIDANVNEQ